LSFYEIEKKWSIRIWKILVVCLFPVGLSTGLSIQEGEGRKEEREGNHQMKEGRGESPLSRCSGKESLAISYITWYFSFSSGAIPNLYPLIEKKPRVPYRGGKG
jgi:hypothetical protein